MLFYVPKLEEDIFDLVRKHTHWSHVLITHDIMESSNFKGELWQVDISYSVTPCVKLFLLWIFLVLQSQLRYSVMFGLYSLPLIINWFLSHLRQILMQVCVCFMSLFADPICNAYKNSPKKLHLHIFIFTCFKLCKTLFRVYYVQDELYIFVCWFHTFLII